MPLRKALSCSILLCPFFALVLSAAETCPATIAVRQDLTAPVNGWQSMLDDTPSRLAGVTFYDGPPSEKASLVNDRTTRSAGKEIATWYFGPRQKREIWLACNYAGTSVVLIKPLPSGTSACTVTYNPRQRIGGLPVIEAIACKPPK